MNTKQKRGLRVLPLVAALALCIPGAASAQNRPLEGTWDVTVTLRDCQSGNAIRTIPRLITFQRGGTVSEAAAGGTEAQPAIRSSGQGMWEHLGKREYTYFLKFLRLTPFGGPDGFIEETRIFELATDHKSYTGEGVAVITFGNGAQSPELCSTEEGSKLY